ncbi:hypothetical protein TNCT_376981 [Trichonephila clavata]|uniref:Uncharacterized protein n=1 Tax=Trichonephila clavata TaxID=2740835 RepID=A0A8X6L7U4_TRICU|nr:hypothetical protein TNCT_376981 [Trichonephila clavata]
MKGEKNLKNWCPPSTVQNEITVILLDGRKKRFRIKRAFSSIENYSPQNNGVLGILNRVTEERKKDLSPSLAKENNVRILS